jgi:hypothetical protein
MYQRERIIPYKRMRRFLKQELDGDVTEGSVKYVTTLLESQLNKLCQEVVIQHQEDNRLRVFHGLPERKRIDVTLYKKFVDIPYKSTSDLNVEGEEANSVYTPLSSKEASIEVQ